MTHPASSPLTDSLCDFIAGFSYASLPPDVLEATRRVIFDGTGALLAAANPQYSTGRLIAEFARSQGGTPESSVVGHSFRTSASMAALANGTMGYACDVEPHHPEAILHPVAIMIPTALAMAERQMRSGADLIGAVALGCEVEYRVSMSLQPAELYALGFHPSAVAGCFGATAAACHLLGLDSEAVQRALGLAACQASGMMAWETDPTENARPFQMGVAARNGVTSALLAASGFGGPMGIFDHGHTIYRAFSRNPAPAKLTDRLGSAWDGVVELAIKPYSCVSFLHPALDALLGLVRENGIVADDIAEVTLRFPKNGIHCVDGNPLKSHCAQYVLPLALANGELRVSDIFVDRRIGDPRIADLCKRVRVTSDPELDPLFPDFYASIIDIDTKGGRRFSRRNDIARGYPETPLAADELDGKFERLCRSVTDDDGLARLRSALDGLSRAPTARAFADALRDARRH